MLQDRFSRNIRKAFTRLATLLRVQGTASTVDARFRTFLGRVHTKFTVEAFVKMRTLLQRKSSLRHSDVFRFLLGLRRDFRQNGVQINRVNIQAGRLRTVARFLNSTSFHTFLSLISDRVYLNFAPALGTFRRNT